MPSDWEPERGQEAWSDREAWRGDIHTDGTDAWRLEAGEGPVWSEEEDDLWEATAAQEQDVEEEEERNWPEDLAGPEYWLFKRDGL